MAQNSRLLLNDHPFTATTNLINLFPGRYINRLCLNLEGDMVAAAAVLPAALAAIIDTLDVFRDGSPVIRLRGDEIWALQLLMFGKNPLTVAAGAATDQTSKIQGLFVPIWNLQKEVGKLTVQVGRTANAGVDTEVLDLVEVSDDKVLTPYYFHAVRMLMTLSAATGFGNRVELPQPGDLIGILFFSTTIPTNAAETASLQEVEMEVDGRMIGARKWEELRADVNAGAINATFASPADATFIDNFGFWDLRDEPIPQASQVVLDINAGVASEAVRIIPIYACKI